MARKRKSGPSMPVRRGEKLSVARGLGLTAKGVQSITALAGQILRLLRRSLRRRRLRRARNHFGLGLGVGRVNVARQWANGGSAR